MDSGCWKAGCRSSRSFAALELLKETSRNTRALVITSTLVTRWQNSQVKIRVQTSALTRFHVFKRLSFELQFCPENTKWAALRKLPTYDSAHLQSETILLYKCVCFVNDHEVRIKNNLSDWPVQLTLRLCLSDLRSNARRSDVSVRRVKMASPVGGAGSREEVNNRGRADGPTCCRDGGRVCCCYSWVPLELFQTLFLQLFGEK